MSYMVAVDAGTGSGRAIVFDEGGREIAAAQQEWTHLPEPGYPGSMSFDVESNWRLLSACIREAIQKSGVEPASIVAVSTTSMREGIVLFDEAGRELWACANVDARAVKEVRDLRRQDPSLERANYEVTGETLALGAIPRLLWIKRNLPRTYERAATMVMLNDWIIARLCGELRSEPSNAGTTGLLSLSDRKWDVDLAKRAGVKTDIYAPIVESGTQVGVVTSAASELTALPTGTPVVAGGGDVQMGCVGLGLVHAGQMGVLGGTFWQQEVNLDEPGTDPEMRVRVNPHAVPGLWQAEAIVFFAGLAVRWFRDAFCGEEQESARRQGIDAYTLLESLAAKAPLGANGIIPVFSNEMDFGNWYHAAPSLLNLKVDPVACGKPEIYRALLENAAVVTASNLDSIRRFTGVEVDTITFAGGASKGALWSQILADVTGRPVRVPVVKESTALGAAIAGGVGVGLYGSIREAAEDLVAWERVYEPSAENHALYAEVRQRWAEAYAAQVPLVDRGVTESMWRAPGS